MQVVFEGKLNSFLCLTPATSLALLVLFPFRRSLHYTTRYVASQEKGQSRSSS